MAAMAPELETQDFMLLPRFGVYSYLMINGHATGWISGETLPSGAAISDTAEIMARSAANYGMSADEVENEVLKAIGNDAADSDEETSAEAIGRRKRGRL
jgi:hypothetical protein